MALASHWQKVPPVCRRWTLRLGIAFVIYSLLGFLVLPAIAKWQLTKQLPGITKRQAEVRQVRMNPWTLSLAIRGLKLKEPDGSVFASWEEFYANFQTSSLFRWAWTFDEIRLQDPFGAIVLQTNGQFNFANLFEAEPDQKPEPKPGAGSGIPRVLVFNLVITNGFVALEDQTRRKPFRTEYRPINLRLTEFTTRPGTGTPYSFRAENDSGKSLAWRGDITVEPFSSHGSIEITGADPAKYQPYLDDFTTAQIVGGRIDTRAEYLFAAGTNGIDLIASNATVRVTGLEVRDPAARETVIKVPLVTVDDAALNLREQTALLGSIKVEKPELIARLLQDGSVNFQRLILTNAPSAVANTNSVPATSTGKWTVALNNFELQGASVAFEDLSRRTRFATVLHPIDFTLKEFTTAPDRDARYQFAVTTEATETVSGGGTVSINPIRSVGEVQVGKLQLPKYWPYAEDLVRGGLKSGSLDVTVPYSVALVGTNLQASVSNLLVSVSNLQVRGPETDEALIAVPELTVSGVFASLQDRTATVTRVATKDGNVLARRFSNGVINLMTFLPAAPPTNSQATTAGNLPEAGSAPAWSVAVNELAVSGYSIALEDQVPATKAAFQIRDLGLNARGLSTLSNRPVTLDLALRLNETGTVAIKGEVCAMPQRAEVELALSQIDLRALQPYVDPFLKLNISSGLFGLNGKAEWVPGRTEAPAARFTGSVELNRFTTADQLAFQEFVKWNALRVDGIDFTMKPDRLKVDSIVWDGFKTSLLIDTNQQVNLLSILPPSPTNAPAATVPAAAPTAGASASPVPFPVAIGTFALTNASFHFSDASLQPNCNFDIQRFSGVIRGISSETEATAEVDFTGHIDDQAPFAVSGRINPLSPALQVNLSVSNSNMQLPVFTPYVEKFGGYPLNKGRLSLGLSYQISGKELKAENKFRVDQLMLGARNDSTNATSLPVKLAIALLKDRNGVIELDVPIAGRLDDPQFRVGKVVLQVIGNVITKAAASPFKLLGSLVGGGEELSFVEFVPGTATLPETETNKVQKLAQALVERPAINLEIEAGIDAHADVQAIALQQVRARIKTERLQELAAINQRPEADSFTVDTADYQRLLRAALVKEFGTNINSALQQFIAAQAATNAIAASNRVAALRSQAPKPKGLIQRVAAWLPLYSSKSPAGAARKQARADAALIKQNPALAGATGEDLELLLASRSTVDPEKYLQLMRERAKAVQQILQEGGQITADRIYLTAPKLPREGATGLPRVTMTLN